MKKYLSIMLILSSFYGFGQNSEVTGVVTYFFNDYQGDKPDLGAMVYLLDSVKAINLNHRTYDTLSMASLYATMVLSNQKIANDWAALGKKKYAEKIKKFEDKAAENYETGKKWGIDRIKEIDLRFATMMIKVTPNDYPNKTVDASGTYKFSNVEPGTYYIYMISNGRKGMLVSNIRGKIFLKKILVKDNQSVNVSHNFYLDSL
jgi:hypothetical protein